MKYIYFSIYILYYKSVQWEYGIWNMEIWNMEHGGFFGNQMTTNNLNLYLKF